MDTWKRGQLVQARFHTEEEGSTLGLLAISYMYDVIIALTATIGI